MDGIIGGIIFEVLGAFLKWFYFFFVRFVKGESIIPFKDILHGKDSDNDYDLVINSWGNKAVGIIFTMSIVAVILYLNL